MAITPDQLKAAEERWTKLRDAGDPAADEAEREFQAMARSYTEAAQSQAYQRMISRMLK